MSNHSNNLESETKRRSLLIAYGCSSSLAKEVLPDISSFTDYILLSSKTGSLEIQGKHFQVTQVYSTSPAHFIDIFEKLKIGRRSNFSEIMVITFSGVADRTVFKNLSQLEIDDLIDINLRGPIYLSSAILNYFGVGKTSLIFISSTRALLGDRGITMYSTTKHALSGLARGLALEYGKFGFRANVLSLGVVPVGLVARVPSDKLEAIVSRSANKDFVDVASIARAIDFLRSNQATNGTILYCDGGYF